VEEDNRGKLVNRGSSAKQLLKQRCWWWPFNTINMTDTKRSGLSQEDAKVQNKLATG